MVDSDLTIAQKAKQISIKLANLDNKTKNRLLRRISEIIRQNTQKIVEMNRLDIQAAEKMLAEGQISKPLLNRLILNDSKIEQLSTYLEEVAKLEDPVGKKLFAMKLAEGMELERISCPIGVVAIIFESRPEVVVQVTALSLKSGNAVILKGGREAANSNKILFQLINQALMEFDLIGTVNLIETREDVAALLHQDESIDLIIPRGSNEFVRYIQENTKIPVLGHSSGICHLYLDKACNFEKAIPVVIDAKLDYPSACNAVETLLIHQNIASAKVGDLVTSLKAEKVKLLGCEQTVKIAGKQGICLEAATEKDWETEYTDLILSIKIVPSLQNAIDHINKFSSHHTDSIMTEDNEAAEFFLQQVDSSCVFHNLSTRFSDGYVFGLGAEVGISTNKTHSRGPVGLEGMVIYKYLLRGNGQVRGAFSGKNAQQFLHVAQPLT